MRNKPLTAAERASLRTGGPTIASTGESARIVPTEHFEITARELVDGYADLLARFQALLLRAERILGLPRKPSIAAEEGSQTEH